MIDKDYLDSIRELISNQINNDKYVLRFKELLFTSVASGNTRNEIRFKDIWGDDFDGEFSDSKVVLWLKMNNIKWQWDDHCLGVMDGFFIIHTKDI